MIHRSIALVTAAMLVALTVSPARAQAPDSGWPSKPIRLIVPFPPGGGGDNLARLIVSRVIREFNQPLVVENVAGAGGNVGAQAAARAAADGYTLFYGTNGTHAINHSLYRSPGFDPLKDFEPVSRFTRIGAIVVTRPGLPVETMADLIRLAREQPGKLSFASAGNGTTSHLAGEMLKAQAGLRLVHIPYRGGALAISDLIGGHVDFMIDVAPNTGPQVRGGKVKALAVSTANRLAGFPDLPTIADAGVVGFDVSAWDGLFVPARTPRAIVDRLNIAVRAALADADLRNALLARASEPSPTSPEEFGRFIEGEMKRWGDAVRQSGAQVD